MNRHDQPCAVCYVDPRTGRLGTNHSTYLCASCRDLPENQDWVAQSRLEESWPSLDPGPGGPKVIGELHEWFGGPLKLDTAKAHAIVRAHCLGGQLVQPSRRSKKRHLAEHGEIYLPPTRREIARRVGCSKAYVDLVLSVYRRNKERVDFQRLAVSTQSCLARDGL